MLEVIDAADDEMPIVISLNEVIVYLREKGHIEYKIGVKPFNIDETVEIATDYVINAAPDGTNKESMKNFLQAEDILLAVLKSP